ncbi:hypothetical protein Celaphus_00017390 [Cervus elaphus hippelaphus]|uniref:Uncharacterized protein n=1 Tax=Cervus elaphus hippelaphus TaxID=46360 RepID=A0A212D678_CEREH|nr:hypothetical protein Celaphus_00017390 [Cervus elaphus hippelaphus]
MIQGGPNQREGYAHMLPGTPERAQGCGCHTNLDILEKQAGQLKNSHHSAFHQNFKSLPLILSPLSGPNSDDALVPEIAQMHKSDRKVQQNVLSSSSEERVLHVYQNTCLPQCWFLDQHLESNMLVYRKAVLHRMTFEVTSKWNKPITNFQQDPVDGYEMGAAAPGPDRAHRTEPEKLTKD